MTPTQSLLAHWYYHLPNTIMMSLIYLLAGRYLLELLHSRRPETGLLKVFRAATDPVARPVRWLTPQIVPRGLVVVVAICWLTAGRMAWFLACVATGMRPSVGG